METPPTHLSCEMWFRSNSLRVPNSTRAPSVPITFDLPILETNEILDEARSTTLRALIATRDESMAVIESRVRDLTKEIEQLRRRWDEIYEERWFAQALVSPVRKIPPEILGEIFAQCVEANLEPIAFESKDAPLLLTAICRRWRQVALDTPGLWRNITICNPPGTAVVKPSFISTWMRNSRSRLLNVSIGLIFDPRSDFEEECDKEEYASIIEMVREQYYRIDRWTLNCSQYIAMALLRPGERHYMTNLRDLSVDFVPPVWFANFEWQYNLPIIEAPRLNSLTICKLGPFFLHAIRPTSNLRRLTISGEYEGWLFTRFLRLCSGLEEIHATDVTVMDPTLPNNQVLLPSLRYFLSDGCSSHLMEFLDTPALQHLVWGPPWHSSYDGTVCKFLLKARSTLSRFCFRSNDGMGMDDGAVSRTIRLLTELETLEISSEPFPSQCGALWGSLTPGKDTPAGSWPCPRLTNLKVSMTILDASFVQFVERRGATTQESSEGYLRSVELVHCCLPDGALESMQTIGRNRHNLVIEMRGCKSKIHS